MEVGKSRSERSDATRLALIGSARRLFGTSSYSEVSLAEIVEASGVTKGALYHHFPGGKKDLMEAVYEQVESEFTENIAAQVLPTLGEGDTDPLDVMEAAIGVTLEASLDSELQQIVLIDSPSVLGWAHWREIADDHSLAVIKALLNAAVEFGSMKPLPVDAVANLLSASISEAIMSIARAEDQEKAKADSAEALGAILDGLRV